MLRYTCTSGHVTLSKITLSHHGVGVDIITNIRYERRNEIKFQQTL